MEKVKNLIRPWPCHLERKRSVGTRGRWQWGAFIRIGANRRKVGCCSTNNAFHAKLNWKFMYTYHQLIVFRDSVYVQHYQHAAPKQRDILIRSSLFVAVVVFCCSLSLYIRNRSLDVVSRIGPIGLTRKSTATSQTDLPSCAHDFYSNVRKSSLCDAHCLEVNGPIVEEVRKCTAGRKDTPHTPG